ncbi:predicted protein [Sclerotinia sclerotiorum 1980 UF-70]|uniref:Uncharacterized protein n=1 Tax=Sclerotinia sclerotiorum (strain ATCC 18683 / 1980 / Ss-1) TaxID=665079 RepID=A7ETE6_SCLS1|nr:predicted protein [Sclerotinia sclerotiorum 1980 UF-70]EDN92738.1 predicted protein [Sclerotinia sclerotiorum 1980 UF-70]
MAVEWESPGRVIVSTNKILDLIPSSFMYTDYMGNFYRLLIRDDGCAQYWRLYGIYVHHLIHQDIGSGYPLNRLSMLDPRKKGCMMEKKIHFSSWASNKVRYM